MAPAKKGTSKGAASAKKKLTPKNASQVKGGRADYHIKVGNK